MAFVNTRDTIGDQATVDGLVEHSLTELKEDGIGIVESYACYKNTGLQSVELPGVSQIKADAFDGCSNLEVVKLGGEDSSSSLSIAANAFNACSKLKHLVIDRPAMATLAATSGLNGTPIENGEGAVYVPENLVATYKANNNWKNYFITKLEKYPLSAFDTIEDSWSTILSNASYSTTYAVNDTKTLELTDGTKIKMDLVAFDTDVKSDNSGIAKMTWVTSMFYYQHAFNSTNSVSGGWPESELRSWLISDILSKIPTEIKSHIVSVKKSSRSKSPSDETLWSDDEIWIPSYREIGLTKTNSIESDGVVYSDFKISKSRGPSIGASGYTLRSVGPDDLNLHNISGGYDYTTYANAINGIVFGFCTD